MNSIIVGIGVIIIIILIFFNSSSITEHFSEESDLEVIKLKGSKRYGLCPIGRIDGKLVDFYGWIRINDAKVSAGNSPRVLSKNIPFDTSMILKVGDTIWKDGNIKFSTKIYQIDDDIMFEIIGDNTCKDLNYDYAIWIKYDMTTDSIKLR